MNSIDLANRIQALRTEISNLKVALEECHYQSSTFYELNVMLTDRETRLEELEQLAATTPLPVTLPYPNDYNNQYEKL